MNSSIHVLRDLLFCSLITISLLFTQSVRSQTGPNLLISEVQIAGSGNGNSGLDFIEIYNPTSATQSLEGLRLVKRSSTAVASTSIAAFTSDESVKAYSYYLWCNTDLTASITCDKNTSATVSDNNSVALINGSLADGAVVDAVTFGNPVSPLGEGTFLTAPEPGKSVERKAKDSSTIESMMDYLLDGLLGNGYDTNNNANDFIVRDTPQPQNTASASEQLMEITPTITSIPTATATPTSTETFSPTVTPTPTNTSTLTPTNPPTPTATTTPTPAPNEKIVSTFRFPGRTVTCKIVYKPYEVLFLKGLMPVFECSSSISADSN